jgi:hypothetical protein
VQAPMTRVGDVGNVCAVEGCLGCEMLMLREKAAWGVRCGCCSIMHGRVHTFGMADRELNMALWFS